LGYKARMMVGESSGERRLLVRLQSEGLMGGCFFQRMVILKVTTPDFLWEKQKLAVYLDGPPHLKSHVMERDEELRELLRQRGWRVLEFPYSPPLSESRLREIVEGIREALPH